MNAVRELRRSADLTPAELARAAGTSQPTIAAYESGRKSPSLRTLSRMARAVGLEAVVVFPPAMTREDRRSLALHRAIADRLKAHLVETLDQARRN
ncbi:MAG: helix-turn-helix transcriptional regulator, partial [Acidimicrobiia bacterium]